MGWHITDVHEALFRFGDRLVPRLSVAANRGPNPITAEEYTSSGGVIANISETESRCGADGTKAFRILFPLCGKSVDMAFLAKSSINSSPEQLSLEVVGIDGVAASLEVFASEYPELEIRRDEQNPQRFRGKNILLIQDDFFLSSTTTTDGSFDAIFDRGSLVAIHPSLREDYVDVIRKLIRPGGRVLLVVIERTEGNKERGPPYSFSEAQVRALYEGREWVDSVTLLENDAREVYVAGTLKSLYFLIQAKGEPIL